ncbi:TonB-dependent receptor [Steroidobacter sp. S1-65]|uniref:TonB-dependent receptor n=1 Tax=Steroidobacter gossypii TaxID=2805490 RepID=A0ABS1X041_9GAMM|nr:TonB-dependent receptor [Steroidobacter gossypii]MBM0106578.1 TonB-dependent receptor [Steroidobacter gossypii]
MSRATEPSSSRSVVALAVVAALAHAQAAGAQNATAADTPPLEEVTVTGSSIKRSDDAALPVTIVSQEAMELRDAATPVDLLTAMPAVVNVPINDSNQGGVSARGDVSSVNLRGIGSGNTLVLLNGRRVAAHGISSTEDGVPQMSVNVNTLPARGLDRVDILRDGASAVYGSDAVAGVINFVTDSDYVGNELQVQTGITEIGSGSDMGLTLTHGNYAFGDRLHWISTFDYLKREELKTSDLPNATDADKRAVAAPGFDAANGPFFDRNASSGFPSFRVGSSTATMYLTPMEGGVIGIKNSAPSRTGAELGYYYDTNADGYSVPETERFNWFNALDFKVNDSLSAFGNLALYRADSTMVRPPVAYGINSDAPLVVSADNPYNPYGSRFYSPTGAPNADGTPRLVGTPQSVTIVSKRFTDIGPETIDVETTAVTATLGLRGDIAPGWSWETGAVYSRAETKDDSLNAVRETALHAQTALTDSTAYNPFGYNFAVQNGQVVATTPYTNPESVTSGFVQRFHQEGRNVLASIDARVNGELWDLGGGPIAIAVGAEHRWDDYELVRPQFAGKNGINDLGLDPEGNDFVQASAAGDVIGDRTVAAAFAEVVVPIVGSMNAMPGIERLQLGASMRYEEYSDFGSTSNPKFTLDWRPVDALMIRASYNEGFRAPNLSVMNYPTRFTVGSYFDPYRGPVTGLPVDGQFQRQTGIEGNQDLVPETAEGRTLGFVLDVPFVEGLRMSVDYWKIEQENLIASPIAEEIRANDAAMLLAATQAALANGVPLDQIDLGSGTENYAGDPLIQRSATITADDRAFFAAYNASRPQSQWLAPVGILEVTYTPYSNLASATIEGYDFNITYNSPRFDWGRLAVSTDATYLDKYERQAGPNAAVETRLGKNGATKWRGSVNVSWSKDDVWSAGISAYYIGDYADTSASISEATYQALGRPSYVYPIDGVYFWRVDDSVTFNAFGAYTFTPAGDSWLSDLNVRVGVKNLTNEDAPLTTDTAGYDSAVYNSVAMGRVWTLRLTKNF